MIWQSAGESVVRFYTQDAGLNTDQATGQRNVSDGAGHHIAVTFDGSTKRLYVDGIQDATSSETTLDTVPTDLWIGDDTSGALGALTATIDEVRMYTRVLSAGEVQALVNQPQTWATPTTAAYWGGRLSSRSTDTDGRWGIDGSSEMWLNVGDGSYEVVRRGPPHDWWTPS